MAKTKKPEQKKMWIIAVMAFLLVATIVGIYSNYQARVGKAVFIGEAPWISGTIDLTAEETVTFRVLPDEEGRGITIRTGTSPYDAAPQNYTFFLAQLDETAYKYSLEKSGEGIARDVLSVGTARDSSFIYIDRENDVADLEVFSQNNQITIKNLHYIQPGAATITLVNGSNVSYPSIIRLEAEEEFTATIWANSSSPPMLRVNVGTLTDVQNHTETNSTTATFTYTAPAESQAVLLDITATVQGRETHAYYTLAIGDVVYALQEANFPTTTLTLLDEATANFTVTFARTRELQPFALPCEISGSTSVNTLFDGTAVERVYTYDTASSHPLDWNQGVIPDDFAAFNNFKGYFVQLRALAEGDTTTISGECTLQDLQPVTGVPSLTYLGIYMLPVGWNLVSLPGTIPRALAEFAATENVRLFTCQQNYVCAELPITTPLTPGKPYWVFTEEQLRLRYTLE
ncbi:MAG: hypothetical protein Q8R53_04075 [Nanoarchaeota archaeon]|nr:hypothetical protein [Nanoarchaeota archaeon]